jgi:hypothetical protein
VSQSCNGRKTEKSVIKTRRRERKTRPMAWMRKRRVKGKGTPIRKKRA